MNKLITQNTAFHLCGLVLLVISLSLMLIAHNTEEDVMIAGIAAATFLLSLWFTFLGITNKVKGMNGEVALIYDNYRPIERYPNLEEALDELQRRYMEIYYEPVWRDSPQEGHQDMRLRVLRNNSRGHKHEIEIILRAKKSRNYGNYAPTVHTKQA